MELIGSRMTLRVVLEMAEKRLQKSLKDTLAGPIPNLELEKSMKNMNTLYKSNGLTRTI